MKIEQEFSTIDVITNFSSITNEIKSYHTFFKESTWVRW